MQLTDPSHVASGMKVYYAQVLNTASIDCFHLTSDPFPNQYTGSLFVEGQRVVFQHDWQLASSLRYGSGAWTVKTDNISIGTRAFSLMDAGVGQHKKYNDHRLFDSLNDAMKYVEWFYSQRAGLATPDDEDVVMAEPESPFDAYDRAMKGI